MNTLQSLRRDLVHAMRTLFKERAFTLVCVISLGIGMGAVVALATFGRTLTAPARGINTDGLVEVLVLPEGPLREKAGEWALERWSYPDYQALRDADVGMDITGWSLESSEFGEATPDQKEPPRVATLYVSSNYFRTFGVSLARGSGFDAALDDSPSAEPRVILSHDFWTSRVAADPDIIGKSVMVDGVPHTVVGIAPEDFRGHFHFVQAPPSLLMVPLERHPRLRQEPNLRNDRTAEWVRIHGRLHPGATLTQANGLVSSAVSTLASRYPETNQFKAATVEPYASLGAAGRPDSLRVFSVLLSLAGAVLLIVCINISGMMLVRGATRAHELSIRAALGADRRTLVQHLFFEAIALACAAGALSAVVLFGIPALIGWWMGVPVPPEIDFDATGVAICGGTLPRGQRALRIAAGHSLQPSQPAAGAAGRCRPRRKPDDSRASHRGDGADRDRRAVSRDQRRDDRSRADCRLRVDDRGVGGRARLPRRHGRSDAGFGSDRLSTISRQAVGVRSVAIADGHAH